MKSVVKREAAVSDRSMDQWSKQYFDRTILGLLIVSCNTSLANIVRGNP